MACTLTTVVLICSFWSNLTSFHNFKNNTNIQIVVWTSPLCGNEILSELPRNISMLRGTRCCFDCKSWVGPLQTCCTPSKEKIYNFKCFFKIKKCLDNDTDDNGSGEDPSTTETGKNQNFWKTLKLFLQNLFVKDRYQALQRKFQKNRVCDDVLTKLSSKLKDNKFQAAQQSITSNRKKKKNFETSILIPLPMWTVENFIQS